jgi:hypothetical protein
VTIRDKGQDLSDTTGTLALFSCVISPRKASTQAMLLVHASMSRDVPLRKPQEWQMSQHRTVSKGESSEGVKLNEA